MNEQFQMDKTSFSGTWNELQSLSSDDLGLNFEELDLLPTNQFNLELPMSLPQGLATDANTSLLRNFNPDIFGTILYPEPEHSSMPQSVPFPWDYHGNIAPYLPDSPSMTSSMEVGVSPAGLASSPAITEYHSAPPNWPASGAQQSWPGLDHDTALQRPPNSSGSGEKKKRFQCIVKSCGKRYSNNRDLDRHYNSHHAEVAKSLGKKKPRTKCARCPKTFARPDHHTRHLANKHGRPRRSPSRRH